MTPLGTRNPLILSPSTALGQLDVTQSGPEPDAGDAATMPSRDAMKSDEANQAAWEAARGGLIGAAKWGGAAAVLGGIGYLVSPVYRGLTIQFKM